MRNIVTCVGAVVVAIALCGAAAAQQATGRQQGVRTHAAPAQAAPPADQAAQATPAAAAAEAPQRTTATYEDWVLQCETVAGPPPEKLCDIAQVTQVQGRNVPFSRVAVARPVKGQPAKLVVQVPVNASFAANVRITMADSEPGLTAPFARCLPAGCFSEFELKDDVMRKFRGSSGAKLAYADAGGHDITVPLSFKGFAQAFDALARE